MKTPTVQLDQYIRARYPVIGIVSHEESRVFSAIQSIAEKRKRKVVTWTYSSGLAGVPGLEAEYYRDPEEALRALLNYITKKQADPTLFVFFDLHKILTQNIMVIRLIRDVIAAFAETRHNMILLSPEITVPADLDKSVVVMDWPLPNVEELAEVLAKCERDIPDTIKVTLNGDRSDVVQSMRGLTEFEAENVLLAAVTETRELGSCVIPVIVREKAAIIRKSGALEFYDQTVTMAAVGGLELLKEYAAIKRAAFTPQAKLAGVDAPKGVLLIGPPGTGKSLSAKAIAGGRMPLLRLDVGALMGSLVGQSEANTRMALKVAEAVSPCVLWIDEIEKALGGSGGEMDGGTSTRVLGTILTWMQETPAPVYMVATANDVKTLRPELLRRFDDVMFVDLPNAEARLEILKVHLAKRNWKVDDLEEIVNLTWGFSGAEIEKVVKSAVETAYFQKVLISPQHLAAAAGRIVPIGITMKEKIDEIRAWAKNRAIEAGAPLEERRAAVDTDLNADL